MEQKLKNQLDKLNVQYHKLFDESIAFENEFKKQHSKYWKHLDIISNKINKITDKLEQIERAKLKSKYSKKEFDAAKAILEDCGYCVVKI